jgi:hypothetical protein
MQSFRKGVGTARRDKNKGRTQGLTEEQKQEIREAFDLFDTDGSGNHHSTLPIWPMTLLYRMGLF